MQDKDFINGIETGLIMVRQIFELSVDERKRAFGCDDVAQILDKFDFQQISELLKTGESNKEKELKHYYIIRGIRINENGKKEVVVESERYKFNPSRELIESFLKYHTLPIDGIPQVDFATVELIWVME